VGDSRDDKTFDSMGRRKTRIVAIDALSRIGVAQYEVENILRLSLMLFYILSHTHTQTAELAGQSWLLARVSSGTSFDR
jgi:Poly (ADP-ribose) glycohydrolase (PARG)